MPGSTGNRSPRTQDSALRNMATSSSESAFRRCWPIDGRAPVSPVSWIVGARLVVRPRMREVTADCVEFVASPRLPHVAEGWVLSRLQCPHEHLHSAEHEQ